MTVTDQLAAVRRATARSRSLNALASECPHRYRQLVAAELWAGNARPDAKARAQLEVEYAGLYRTLYRQAQVEMGDGDE